MKLKLLLNINIFYFIFIKCQLTLFISQESHPFISVEQEINYNLILQNYT